VIDRDDIRLRWQQTAPLLDERDRRLFAANEAMAHGYGGVMAVSAATGLARSTINRGIQQVRSACDGVVKRVRRPGAGRKTAVTHQPGLPAALETLIEDAAIRARHCCGSAAVNGIWSKRWRSRGSRRASG
jgi:hypothetical protein